MEITMRASQGMGESQQKLDAAVESYAESVRLACSRCGIETAEMTPIRPPADRNTRAWRAEVPICFDCSDSFRVWWYTTHEGLRVRAAIRLRKWVIANE